MNKDFAKYTELDELAVDGTYTAPQDYKTDLVGLREYCKETGKRMEDLTGAEVGRFNVLEV